MLLFWDKVSQYPKVFDKILYALLREMHNHDGLSSSITNLSKLDFNSHLTHFHQFVMAYFNLILHLVNWWLLTYIELMLKAIIIKIIKNWKGCDKNLLLEGTIISVIQRKSSSTSIQSPLSSSLWMLIFEKSTLADTLCLCNYSFDIVL